MRDKCHAAARFSISRFMAISVPVGFALIIPRLNVRVSQSVRLCFTRLSICWFLNCVLLLPNVTSPLLLPLYVHNTMVYIP